MTNVITVSGGSAATSPPREVNRFLVRFRIIKQIARNDDPTLSAEREQPFTKLAPRTMQRRQIHGRQGNTRARKARLYPQMNI